MSANSKIEWTDHTFNPWIGCTKVSAGCTGGGIKAPSPQAALDITEAHGGVAAPRRGASGIAEAARRAVQEGDYSKRERALLHLVIDWSLARGREWCVADNLGDLVALTGIDKADVSRALSGLQKSGVLHYKRSDVELRLRFLPAGALLPPASAVDEIAATAVRGKLERLNAFPDGYEGTGQARLPVELAEERLEDEQAAMSREDALSRAAQPGERVSPETGGRVVLQSGARFCAGAVGESPTAGRAGVGDSPTLVMPPAQATAARVPACAPARGFEAKNFALRSNEASGQRSLASGGSERRKIPDMAILEKLDELAEAEGGYRGDSQRTWENRVAFHPAVVSEGLADLKLRQEPAQLAKFGQLRSKLGWLFTRCRTIARSMGREMRMLLW
jgi:hypothetical protein